MLYKAGRILSIILVHLLFSIRIVGEENIPRGQGFILVANHRSNLDPLFVAQKVREQIHFMAKAELFRGRLLTWLFNGLGAFPVERGKGDTGAIDRAREIIREGKVLGMFPEGTRSKDSAPLRPKSGAAIVAMQTGADVLPCAVCFGKRLYLRSRVTICYGRLLKNSELGFSGSGSPHEIKEASRRMMNEIVRLMEENR